MRIFYCLSAYISHRLAGLEYINCLKRLGHEVYCNYPDTPQQPDMPEQTSHRRGSLDFCAEPELMQAASAADLVILHEDPAWYSAFYENLPFLRQKRVIAYLPWENERLPEAFIEPLSLVSAIWTCSTFCRSAFQARFANVAVLPHVVRRPRPSKGDLAWATRFLHENGAQGSRVFFSVIDGLNPRKNLPALLAAFGVLRRECDADVRLVIKQYRAAMPINQPGVLSISEMLTAGQMAALHAVSHAYVSPHRAEGWGLGLSTAMSFGKVAIATGYSGNLEFMSQSNSLLLPYRMEPVSAEMTEKIPLFTKEMLWAEVDMAALANAMRQVAENRVAASVGQEAALITQRFGPEQIAMVMERLLGQ